MLADRFPLVIQAPPTPTLRFPVGPSVNQIGHDNVHDNVHILGRGGAAVVDGDRQLPPADMMAICVGGPGGCHGGMGDRWGEGVVCVCVC